MLDCPPKSAGMVLPRPKVTIALPRRSAYVLSGEALLLRKHKITGVKKPVSRGAKAAPAWNAGGVRRTLRSAVRDVVVRVRKRNNGTASSRFSIGLRSARRRQRQSEPHDPLCAWCAPLTDASIIDHT